MIPPYTIIFCRMIGRFVSFRFFLYMTIKIMFLLCSATTHSMSEKIFLVFNEKKKEKRKSTGNSHSFMRPYENRKKNLLFHYIDFLLEFFFLVIYVVCRQTDPSKLIMTIMITMIIINVHLQFFSGLLNFQILL